MNSSLSTIRLPRVRVFWTLPCSGVLIGLNAPGFHTQWVGLFAFVPLLLLLEKWFAESRSSLSGTLGRSFLACWLTGAIGTSIGAYWITNSAHVFGHLPWVVAQLITAAGYGLEVGLMLFFALTLPLAVIRPASRVDLPIRAVFFTVIDGFYPRLIHWTYGGLTFSGFPLLEQSADLIGSSGLTFLALGSNFLIIGWIRRYQHGGITPRFIVSASILYLLLIAGGMGYGSLRLSQLDSEENNSTADKIWIGAVQPNFSLQNLASNPGLAHSTRVKNLDLLLADTEKVLRRYPDQSGLPKLIVWPESVYPDPFFKVRQSRERVRKFARENRTSILLASIDWEYINNTPRFHGISVLVGPDGNVLDRYNKIFLIPFGETNPFAVWFPAAAEFLRDQIRNMSVFEAGDKYSVFTLPSGLRLSPTICFDIFSPRIVRNMAQNGAAFAANLSNLAWFGRTTASDNMEAVVRWRAIENRIPVLFVSNNGKSVFIGPDGSDLTPKLGLFAPGVLETTVLLKPRYSFYRNHGKWVRYGILALLILLLTILFMRRAGTRAKHNISSDN